jgi:hypothetical protein
MEFEELWTIGTILMGITIVATCSGIFYHAVLGAGFLGKNLLMIGFALFLITVFFTVIAVLKVYTQHCRLRYRRKSLRLDD